MYACAVLSGDTKSSDTNSGEEEMVGPSRESPLAPVICSTKDFPQEQYDSLSSAFQQVIKVDVALKFLYFVMSDSLY